MASAVPPPSGRLKMARDVGLALLALGLAAALFLGLDAAIEFPPLPRCLLFLLWIGLAAFALAWGLIRFRRAHSIEPSSRPATVGVVLLALLIGVTAVLAVPGPGERVRRFALPWHHAAHNGSFRLVASSGDPIVRRGDAVTLSAYLEHSSATGQLPETADLTWKDGPNGAENRLAMKADGKGAFHVTRPDVKEDFLYRVQVGPVASEWRQVTAIEPAEVDSASRVDIALPEYAARILPATGSQPLTEIEAIQHSVANLRLVFTRPAAAVFLEFRPDGPAALSAQVPFHLAADRASATAALEMTQPGVLRVIAIAEKNGRQLRTHATIPVRVAVDAPPRFEQVSGVPLRGKVVRPNASLAIDFIAGDDVAVAAAELEYALGPDLSAIQRQKVPLLGLGSSLWAGRLVWPLAGRVKEGDVVRFRVRIADNRDLPALKLGPRDAAYPPKGWVELKVSASAPSLARQEFFGQRDSVKEWLDKALGELRVAEKEVGLVRAEFAGQTELTVDQRVRLENARERAAAAAEAVNQGATEAALSAELRALSTSMRDAARPLIPVRDWLRKAPAEKPSTCLGLVKQAHDALKKAEAECQDLHSRNNRLAQERLDRRDLAALAAEQQQLAERAHRDRLPPEAILPDQNQLLERLQAIVANSPPLRQALGQLAARDIANLESAVADLAVRQQELALAGREVREAGRLAVLEPLVRGQREISRRLAEFSRRAETAARLAGLPTPTSEPAEAAADLLAFNNLLDALAKQEEAAQAFDRLAQSFEAAAAERRDPKEAARQLARWQDDLRGRLKEATRNEPFPKLPAELRSALADEQNAIRISAGRLRLPPLEAVADARQAAKEALTKAAESLVGDGRDADERLLAAGEALAQLADKTASLAERLARVRVELDRARAEQDAIAVAAESAFRIHTRPGETVSPAILTSRLAQLGARQMKVGTQLVMLDLPGFEVRKGRLAELSDVAAASLKEKLPFDSAAAQSALKRELERLKQACDGIPPADEVVDDIVLKQAALAEAVGSLMAPPTAKQREQWLAESEDFSRRLAKLTIPESPVLMQETREALRTAERALREKAELEALRQKIRTARQALGRLAARLNGGETEVERIKRLAQSRRLALKEKHKSRTSDLEAAAEAGLRYAHEVEELVQTRIGPAQAQKKKVLDLYHRLRMHPTDRAAQKAVADALDELAEAVAAVPALSAHKPRPPVEAVDDPADAYLPSFPLASLARSLAALQRDLRAKTGRMNEDAIEILRPSEIDPFLELESSLRSLAKDIEVVVQELARAKSPAGQSFSGFAEGVRFSAILLQRGQLTRARSAAFNANVCLIEACEKDPAIKIQKKVEQLAMRNEDLASRLLSLCKSTPSCVAHLVAVQEDLARRATELMLTAGQAGLSTAGSTPKDSTEAMALLKFVGQAMSDAAKKARAGAGDEMEASQRSAYEELQKAGALLKPLSSKTPVAAVDESRFEPADAVRRAERAMRQVLEDAARPNPSSLENNMKSAADALSRAAESIGRAPVPKVP